MVEENTRVTVGSLAIERPLFDFTKDKLLCGLGIDVNDFWKAFETIVAKHGAQNEALLEKRKRLEKSINDWHDKNPDAVVPSPAYKDFLREIGYLVDDGLEGSQDLPAISVANIDREISEIAGPQLVVPLSNMRYALNAANARWGNLFDALYGTDAIPDDNGCERHADGTLNLKRSERVFQYVDDLLDKYFPLADSATHAEVTGLVLDKTTRALGWVLKDGRLVGLQQPEQFVGYNLATANNSGLLSSVLLVHNQLHIELCIDAKHAVGKAHHANINAVFVEAAISTIMDCEDSVSAVDAADKINIYQNWLEIMQGTACASFTRASKPVIRKLNADREYVSARSNLSSDPSCSDAAKTGVVQLKGRSLCLVRNVGIMMYTDAVLTTSGKEIPEHFLDAMITTAAAIHDIKRLSKHKNSEYGSVYIVKPKMHGPEEVAFVSELFSDVEAALGLPLNTIKMGIMDEERRTTVNLGLCIQAAKERVIFINTGFLDRTGDEIHTSMHLGAMLPKAELKTQVWFQSYENWNVQMGLKCGLFKKAQIGKGMWAAPDCMQEMLATKVAHPKAGANCAWVPSPTAATLHAMHYHEVHVPSVQKALQNQSSNSNSNSTRASLDCILTPPIMQRRLTSEEIEKEVRANAQSILGYVVRWVDQGVGCSKVPDINSVGLMEDRATLRISSQLLANWIYNNIVSRDVVLDIFKQMAVVVDQQNAGDPAYRSMAPAYSGHAWHAAIDLVLTGKAETNGYTERVLNKYRRLAKASSASS